MSFVIGCELQWRPQALAFAKNAEMNVPTSNLEMSAWRQHVWSDSGDTSAFLCYHGLNDVCMDICFRGKRSCRTSRRGLVLLRLTPLVAAAVLLIFWTINDRPWSIARDLPQPENDSVASKSFSGPSIDLATGESSAAATSTTSLTSSSARTSPSSPPTLWTNTTANSSLSSTSPTSPSDWTGPPPFTFVALPSLIAAPQYIFVYGDSFTRSIYDPNGARALDNSTRDSVLAAVYSTGKDRATWVNTLTSNIPRNVLVYNFAQPGAMVDNPTAGPGEFVPDFRNQSALWLNAYATSPPPSYTQWTANNSIHVIWFGHNDAYFQIQENASLVERVNRVTTLYIRALEKLRVAGGRRFVIMGIPPMLREPMHRMPSPWKTELPVTIRQWNNVLKGKVTAWQRPYRDVVATWLDTWPAFSRVLDNPALWNVVNTTCYNDADTGRGDCAWADSIHPGPPLAKSIGIAVGQHLLSIGFLSAFGLQ